LRAAESGEAGDTGGEEPAIAREGEEAAASEKKEEAFGVVRVEGEGRGGK